jgi:hypothetical protein
MADNSWGYGSPNQPETGLSQVLAGYASRGGQLLGARRWPDNPLTLTHVRWVGPDGFSVEAARRPDDDETTLAEEREIWVDLALKCQDALAMNNGTDATWLALPVEPPQVAEWLRRLQRARASQYSGQQMQSGGYVSPHGQYTAAGTPPPPYASPQPPYGSGYNSGFGPGAMGMPAPLSHPLRSQPRSVPSLPETYGPVPPPISDPDAWTGSWQRGQFEGAEVTVLPCIEVEMPIMPSNPAAAEGIRDFTRDVAMNFSRACMSIPQVRETRGWMQGDRMVLAARIAVAPGTRAPTRAELEGAAHMLADALAQRTLPYSRMLFADAGAWAQGTPLPA